MSHRGRLLDFAVSVIGAAITHAVFRWVDKFFDPPEDTEAEEATDEAPAPAVIDELSP